ncbi:hypothetical protein [Aquibacillus albus]|uniref:DNA invertase Pin-like site-specific DNA recombinase n=1 Tax=Aquibacillus albus TaxID=1168171 RepID=A0ABS2N3G0_9BACI|nr:hypothetical protein [Aquibacillus albus]MBM7572668.1 DNA invertase Pin-like site-specific DNA recombinase [Aquibacillus albus]
MCKIERDLIAERTKAGLEFSRARGRKGGRSKKNQKDRERELKLYDTEQYYVNGIAEMTGASTATIFRE